MPAATGAVQTEPEGTYVLVSEEKAAHRLHNRGRFGVPSAQGLKLHNMEARYLVEEGRLTMENAIPESGIHPGGTAMSCYRDLRGRGLLVRLASEGETDHWKSDQSYLRVWARDTDPKGPPAHHYYPFAERSPVTMEELSDIVASTQKRGVRAVAAVRDAEGEMTYFELLPVQLSGGKVPALAIAPKGATLTYLGDQLVVGGADLQGQLQAGCYGRDTAAGHRVSWLEGLHLALEHKVPVTEGGLETLLQDTAQEPGLGLRLVLYRQLRSQGYLPRTGFKFGTHFRVYDKPLGSGHAPWLVQAFSWDHGFSWPELARMVRLTHGVHKRLWLARVSEVEGKAALAGESGADNGIEMVEMNWVRP